MRPNPTFLHQHKQFWAQVRTISQELGYTNKKTAQIKVPTVTEMIEAFRALGLDPTSLGTSSAPSATGRLLHDYFAYRADLLNRIVEPLLMNAAEAGELFRKLKSDLSPRCPVPMNKQKGSKKTEAFLTGMVNMLIESAIKDAQCNYDPRILTTFTANGAPIRTLARRVDGAFPGPVNPVAIWEIKEYYYTTTFGSRVADGVYETLLDGLELEELSRNEGISVKHYLMIDSHFTWWKCGKSYLCRIIDMLHMGYLDEVFFGREVIAELPRAAMEWVELLARRDRRNP